MRFGLIFLLSLAVTVTGCGDDDDGGTDTGSTSDTGRDDASSDAGTDTATGEDTGPGEDTGSGEDTGAGEDTGGTDAGDAGGEDAGPISMPCELPAADCDVTDMSACEAGEACRPLSDGTAMCLETGDETVATNEECMRTSDCGPGDLCVRYGADEPSFCLRLCRAGSIGECGEGYACNGGLTDRECLRACRPIAPACDILAQDCPDDGQACTLARHPETRAPYFACRTAGENGIGERCGGDEGGCTSGTICINSSDGNAYCRQVCNPDGEPRCTEDGETCRGFAPTWEVSYCRPAA